MILTGLDRLQSSEWSKKLTGKRYGLITHPAAISHSLQSSIKVLKDLGAGELVALFGAEHGVYGDLDPGEHVPFMQDEKTMLPMYSIYGSTYEPTDEMLKGLDLIVYDMQDVGARYFTYVSTLRNVMKKCAQTSLPLWVLDRPNPLGRTVEGRLPQAGEHSFVCFGPVPHRHGMTLGEIALYLKDVLYPQVDLTVVPLTGWSGEMGPFGLWVPPSPNINGWDAVFAYPGTCLVEGVDVSLGRGTPQPFIQFGHPQLDSAQLLAAMKGRLPDNVVALETSFIPKAPPFVGERCYGIRLHFLGGDVPAFRVGVELLWALRQTLGERFAFTGKTPWLDRLNGGPALREALVSEQTMVSYFMEEAKEVVAFRKIRAPYLLYGTQGA